LIEKLLIAQFNNGNSAANLPCGIVIFSPYQQIELAIIQFFEPFIQFFEPFIIYNLQKTLYIFIQTGQSLLNYFWNVICL